MLSSCLTSKGLYPVLPVLTCIIAVCSVERSGARQRDANVEKLSEGYGLVEGPIWVPGHGLMFSDVLNGGVFCLDADGARSVIFKHRRGIGGMSLHENGGMIVSGRNISWKSIPETETLTILERDEAAELVGFNDITADEKGRVYAGGLGASPVFEDGQRFRL